MKNLKSTSRLGSYNELLVEAECIRRGWQVFGPTLPDGEVDLLVINEQRKIHGIQVRSACSAKSKEHPHRLRIGIMRCRDSGWRRYSELVTIFAAVRGQRIWIFPASEFKGARITFSELGGKYEGAWHFIGEATSNLLSDYPSTSKQLGLVL